MGGRRSLPDSDPVVIASVPELRLQHLQTFLGALYARDPSTDVEIRHLPTGRQAALLLNGELEVGLMHDVIDDERIATEPLFDSDPVEVFVPVSHRLAAAASISPSDLRKEVLLTRPRSADAELSDRFGAALGDAGYRFREIRETRGADVRDVMFLVVQGAGLTLSSPALLNGVGDLASLVAHRPLDPPLRMPGLVVAWRADMPPASRATIDAAREVARELRASSTAP
jgi:hypothetical protein